MPPVPTAAPAQLAAAPPRLRQAAQAFEAQALSQLLAPAFATVGQGAFGGGAAEAQWRPMLLDAMAGAAARSGNGIGIGDLVLREMLRLQSATSEPQPPAPESPR
jgi:flagellar protein FlgJ